MERDITQGYLDMTLGGKTYRFTWGTKGLREMQKRVSTPERLVQIDEIFREAERNNMEYMCLFIWGGLIKHQPDITLEDVDDIIDGATQDEIKALMREFGMDLTPDPADAKELSAAVKARPRKARAKRGTGASSTSKPAVLA